MAIALNEIHAEHGVDLRLHPGAVQAVRKAAIEAKILLSTEPVAHFNIELPNGDRYQRGDSPRGFRVAHRAGCSSARPARASRHWPTPASRRSRLTKWLLVGGSTRIPAVASTCCDLFHLARRAARNRNIELNPDEVVALGAAVAGRHSGRLIEEHRKDAIAGRDAALAGIEALGGTVARIIQRQLDESPPPPPSTLPTGVDGQANVAIHVRAGRTRTGRRLPLACPLRPQGQFADERLFGLAAAHRSQISIGRRRHFARERTRAAQRIGRGRLK